MRRKELKILGLSYSQSQIGSYVLVLSEKKGNKKIPLIIKPTEAQRIALDLEGIKSPRPLTHDLVKSVTDAFEIDVQEVFIYSLAEGIFYTKIIASNGIEEVEIECTGGDGIALSVIYKCPIYVTTEILDSVGIVIADDGSGMTDNSEDDDEGEIYESPAERVVSIEDLEHMMNDAIENEEYEIAAEIRDRISKLKGE
jgi:bifunctional DNase/RNase